MKEFMSVLAIPLLLVLVAVVTYIYERFIAEHIRGFIKWHKKPDDHINCDFLRKD